MLKHVINFVLVRVFSFLKYSCTAVQRKGYSLR